jgi:hypothetical protein
MDLLSLHSDILQLIYQKLDNPSLLMLKISHRRFYHLDIKYSYIIPLDCCQYGYLNLLQWLYPRKNFLTDNLHLYATRYGQLSVLEWECTVIPLQEYTSDKLKYEAARKGQFEVLKWLFVKYPETAEKNRENILASSVSGGSIEIIQYLQNNGFLYSIYLMLEAVCIGNLEITQLLSTQIPRNHWNYNFSLTRYASLNNHYHILKWLREQNPPCPWGEDVRLKALQLGIV